MHTKSTADHGFQAGDAVAHFTRKGVILKIEGKMAFIRFDDETQLSHAEGEPAPIGELLPGIKKQVMNLGQYLDAARSGVKPVVPGLANLPAGGWAVEMIEGQACLTATSNEGKVIIAYTPAAISPKHGIWVRHVEALYLAAFAPAMLAEIKSLATGNPVNTARIYRLYKEITG